MSSEFGLEFKMFQNRFYGDFSYYNIRTEDMIFNVPVPPGTGYSFFKENLGVLTNKGIEVLIGGTPVETESFRWDTSLNFSKNKNEVVELIDDLESFSLNSLGNFSARVVQGEGIGDLYGTTWKRNENGELLVNSEGIPLAGDVEKLGSSQPDAVAGFSNTFSYNNWSLRFLVDARFGGEVYSATSSYLDAAGVSERSLEFRDGGVVVDAINEETGAQNTETITAQEYWGAYSGITSNYIYDQTNVRLREFALNYMFPRSAIEGIGLNQASIGLIGRNLFFIYKDAEDIDPDSSIGTGLSGQGISLNNAPTLRSIGVNVNIKF